MQRREMFKITNKMWPVTRSSSLSVTPTSASYRRTGPIQSLALHKLLFQEFPQETQNSSITEQYDNDNDKPGGSHIRPTHIEKVDYAHVNALFGVSGLGKDDRVVIWSLDS